MTVLASVLGVRRLLDLIPFAEQCPPPTLVHPRWGIAWRFGNAYVSSAAPVLRCPTAQEDDMNSLAVISIISWIVMWLSFHFGHPVGYVVAIVGLATAVAIAGDAPARRRGHASKASVAEPVASPKRARRPRAIPLAPRMAEEQHAANEAYVARALP